MTLKGACGPKNVKKTPLFLKNQGSDFPAYLGFVAPFALLPRCVCWVGGDLNLFLVRRIHFCSEVEKNSPFINVVTLPIECH